MRRVDFGSEFLTINDLKLSNFKPSWVYNDVTCLLIAGVSERSSIKLEHIRFKSHLFLFPRHSFLNKSMS